MSEIIAIATVRAITSQTTKEVMDLAKNKIKGYQALKKLSENNDDLMASIEKLMWVKTLFSGAEKPVNLFDFFQKPQLGYLEETIFTIDNLQEVSVFTDIVNKNLIFRGTVGQGKSIFMRFLAIKDIVTTQRIPIFIELKNISKNKSVIDLIKEYLATWVGGSDEVLSLVLKSGKITLFLDAFDEIDPDLIQSAYRDINDLCQNYRKLTVIVSSRPDTLIINSQYLNVIDLQPYGHKEQVGLIEKLVQEDDNKKFLIESINNSTHEVRYVLTTPLMVVLFIKQYTVGFSVPNHVVDFYKNIFDVVTFTHDRSKGIEKRQSFSSLNQIQLESVFERFCFETFLIQKTVFSKDDFVDLLKNSIKKNNINNFEDYSQLINDYTKFACLILQDGVHYTFIHKSIQEFYVARYITNLNEDLARKVIAIKFCEQFIMNNYLQFINILKPYYFKNFFLLKIMDNYAEESGFKYSGNNDDYKKFIGIFFICKVNKSEGEYIKSLGVLSFGYGYNIFDYQEFYMLTRSLIKLGILDRQGIYNIYKKRDLSFYKGMEVIPILDLYNIDDILGNKALRKFWKKTCDHYLNIVKDVKEMENQVTEDDLGI